MPSLRQSSHLLSIAYGAPETRLEGLRNELVKARVLPAAKGRSIPEATSEQIGIMVIALGISDASRIALLANLDTFMLKADLRGCGATLAGALGGYVDAASQSAHLEGITVKLSTHGVPHAWIERRGIVLGSFGDSEAMTDYIQRHVSIELEPLTAFAVMASNTCKPFKAA